MARLTKLRRVLIYSVTSVAALLLLSFAAIHIEQEILRYRTQRLLADIRSINLRRTTFADVQPILRRWHGESHYDQPCSTNRCDVTIALPYAAFYKSGIVYWADTWFVHCVIRATILARAHPFIAIASISVRNNTVWGKSFDLAVQVGPYHAPDRYEETSYTLFAEVETVSRFSFGRQIEEHPDYQVGKPGGCEGCVAVWAKFTPYANSADVSRLMQFNLNCITQWRPCRTQQDIMPVVWAQVQREEELPYAPLVCASPRVEIAARDAEGVAVAQILRVTRPKNAGGKAIFATARLVQHLKRGGSWKVGMKKEVWIPWEYIVSAAPKPSAVRVGTRWILLFDINFNSVDTHECGMVPLNDTNLDVVRKGISQDYLAADDE